MKTYEQWASEEIFPLSISHDIAIVEITIHTLAEYIGTTEIKTVITGNNEIIIFFENKQTIITEDMAVTFTPRQLCFLLLTIMDETL